MAANNDPTAPFHLHSHPYPENVFKYIKKVMIIIEIIKTEDGESLKP